MEVLGGTSSIIIDMLRRNVAANAARFAHPPRVRTVDWSEPADVDGAHAASPDGAGFDLILGSDVTYQSASHGTLVAAIARLLRPTTDGAPPSMALIAHDTRRENLWGVDVQLRSFEDAALAGGLCIRRSRLRCEETDSDGYLLQLML